MALGKPASLEETVSSMQDHRNAQSLKEPGGRAAKTAEVVALPAIPSFSFGDAKNILDIEVQADQLLNYINKLTSLADRACTTALQQSETTQRVEDNRHSEVVYLRRQLDQANTQFREQQRAMTRLEQASRAQLTTLEKQLHRKEIETMEREIDALRSNGAGMTIVREKPKQTEEPRQSVVQMETPPPNQELAHLKQQLAARDETIETKNRMIKAIEGDFQSKIAELEQRLRDTQQELQVQEAKVKEKDTLLQATAAKEVEMGNLIKRLSGECEQLNRELQQISQPRIADADKVPSGGETKIWRRVFGRLQEGL
jgi:DNA repair exonuclease SbcCD ATPase subunit